MQGEKQEQNTESKEEQDHRADSWAYDTHRLISNQIMPQQEINFNNQQLVK